MRPLVSQQLQLFFDLCINAFFMTIMGPSCCFFGKMSYSEIFLVFFIFFFSVFAVMEWLTHSFHPFHSLSVDESDWPVETYKYSSLHSAPFDPIIISHSLLSLHNYINWLPFFHIFAHYTVGKCIVKLLKEPRHNGSVVLYVKSHISLPSLWRVSSWCFLFFLHLNQVFRHIPLTIDSFVSLSSLPISPQCHYICGKILNVVVGFIDFVSTSNDWPVSIQIHTDRHRKGKCVYYV